MADLLRHQALFITPGKIEDEDVDGIVDFIQLFAWDLQEEGSFKFSRFYSEATDNTDELNTVGVEEEEEEDEILQVWLADVLRGV